jgi:prophage maintenance system killer protein
MVGREATMMQLRFRRHWFAKTGVPPFAQGNKRTALLAAKCILDHNGVDGAS